MKQNRISTAQHMTSGHYKDAQKFNFLKREYCYSHIDRIGKTNASVPKML